MGFATFFIGFKFTWDIFLGHPVYFNALYQLKVVRERAILGCRAETKILSRKRNPIKCVQRYRQQPWLSDRLRQ